MIRRPADRPGIGVLRLELGELDLHLDFHLETLGFSTGNSMCSSTPFR